MKSSLKNTNGFISIIAIGIFALLMIFGIALQMTVIDTLQNLKNGVNYDSARDAADSTIEYLQKKMQSFLPGLNDNVSCTFPDTNSSNPKICSDLTNIIGTKKANVTMVVKGRSCSVDEFNAGKCSTNDKLASAACSIPTENLSSTCYVTPIPGTGDAGKNCAMYTPNVTVQSTTNVDLSLTNNITVDQVNYTCNWNKLVFGSNQTDRVAIPLYYDSSTGLGGTSGIKNPFMDSTAKNIIVRLRTPCKPCVAANPTNDQRTCDPAIVKDDTVCADTDRYVLDAGDGTKTSVGTDDIVVQWNINGECGKEACGVSPIADKTNYKNTYSALYEDKIYANSLPIGANKSFSTYQIISNKSDTYDINNYPNTTTLIIGDVANDPKATPNKLSQISKPVLTLFLSKPLLTANKNNIPYLEYQVLTDAPIGNSKSSLDVTVNVEGNTFRKTLTQDVQKALIDFAIHN